MNISASVKNSFGQHEVSLTTNNQSKSITIPAKPEGFGSSANGGELLFLALATCFCNDTYREAAKRNMTVHSVEVTVEGAWGGEGEPARSISYGVQVTAPDHTKEEVEELVRFVDRIAEVHNTIRMGMEVTLRTNG